MTSPTPIATNPITPVAPVPPAGAAADVSPAATTWAPTAKVSAGVLAAAATTLLLSFWKGLEAPQAAAVTTIITFAIQYLVPERG
ncbi:MAG TPA: hypothetical protein VFV34_03280 [Blastocatellia bacterium]|nr:hypothetical protein [Blastocatellia bacterium]